MQLGRDANGEQNLGKLLRNLELLQVALSTTARLVSIELASQDHSLKPALKEKPKMRQVGYTQ